MSENKRFRASLIAKLALTIAVAGVLVAGLLLPWVGGVGLVARNSATLLHALPGELTDAPPAGATRILAADGSLITNFYANDRTPVPSNKIAPIMKQALVDIEDSRFYEHNGVDMQGTVRALVTNVASGSVREGGSTLTQQLVKQTLLQTATSATERTAATEQTGLAGVSRKLKEARLALALEQQYSKDQILTKYLNIVYFGEGAYGIQAAAHRYFSVDASALTLPQAAMLAGLVQSPSGDDPIANPENAMARRNQVIERMKTLRHISATEAATIEATKVAVKPGGAPPNGCIDAALGGFFCSYVYDYVTGKLGLTQNQLDTAGLTIQTTLDPKLQRSADQGVLGNVPMGDKFAAVLDAVQPGTGHVLAMSENRRFGCNGPACESVNLNVAPSHGSGSTYKVFTAAAALSAGFGAHYTIYAPQPYTSKVYTGYRNKVFGPLVVYNDDPRYKSTYDMTSGLVASANTYYVGLEDALGSIDGPVDTAVAMGMHFNGSNQHSADFYKKHQIGLFTLGPDATSPLDLASAYSTVAASGTHCDPTPVTKILDQNGQPLKNDKGQVIDTGNHCKPNALAPGVANTLANMMVGVVSPAGTGRKAIIPGHDIGGKTGTTQDNQTAAFGGITPDYAVSVMYFSPLGKANVGGVGGGVPAKIFHDTMAPILGPQPNHPFPPADPVVEAGTRGGGYVAPPKAAPVRPSTPSPGPTLAPAPPTPSPTAAPTKPPAKPTAGGQSGPPGFRTPHG